MAFREWSILTAHFVFSRADLFTRSVLATGRSVRMIVETFEVIERHSNEVFNPEIVIAHGLFKPDGNIPGQLEKSTTDTAKALISPGNVQTIMTAGQIRIQQRSFHSKQNRIFGRSTPSKLNLLTNNASEIHQPLYAYAYKRYRENKVRSRQRN